MLSDNEADNQPIRPNFKSVHEIERILEECIRIAKDNQHMINVSDLRL